VKDDEVAILLLDDKENLKFFQPEYLKKSGLIPKKYARSFVTKVLHECKPLIENQFSTTPHLAFFEGFDKKSEEQTIQKMMCIPLVTSSGQVFGALQIGRKGDSPGSAGPDWTQPDVLKIVKAIGSVVDDLQVLCKRAGI